MRHMNPDLDSIGSRLLQHSETASFSATGALDRLFPFIYQASQRMSSRAIAAWLAKEHNVQLGYTSISRALRHKERRLQDFAEEIEMAANALAGETRETVERVLTDEIHFRSNKEELVGRGPRGSADAQMSRYSRIAGAVEELDSRWWVLSEDIRAEVLEFITGDHRLEDDEEARDAFEEQDEELRDRP